MLLLAALIVCSIPSPLPAQIQAFADSLRPVKGEHLERTLAGGESHAYSLFLDVGQFLLMTVDQRGIDVVVKVYDPSGKKLEEIDSPNGTEGPEPVALRVTATGRYRFVIVALDSTAPAGKYEIRIDDILTPEHYAALLAHQAAVFDAAKLWVKSNAIPLTTVEAGHGFKDMQPLKRIVGKARIVSLGEATHGTREFFQLKHRMLEFLAGEMGFTVFAIEATMPESFDVNDFVLYGRGDPVKALAGTYFWTWDTEEVLAMIRWMRSYNENPAHTRKLKFYGFDMQSTPRAAKVALTYLSHVDAESAPEFAQRLSVFRNGYNADKFSTLPVLDKTLVAATAESLLVMLDRRKASYLKKSTLQEYSHARQHAAILVQSVHMSLRPQFALAIRDSSMAANVTWILDQEGPDAKIVLWAHNAHVSTQEGWMGMHLRRKYGDRMVVFGFDFYEGSFQAMEMPFASGNGLRSFRVGPGPDTSLDAALASAGVPVMALDLHSISGDRLASEWFSVPRLTRNLGAAYSEQQAANFFQHDVPARIYDAMLFVSNTTAARSLPAGLRPPVRSLKAPSNLDFESGQRGSPPCDWTTPPGSTAFDYYALVSDDQPAEGKQCAMISRTPGSHYGETSCQLSQRIDATPFRKSAVKIHVSARADQEGAASGAYLLLTVTRGDQTQGLTPARPQTSEVPVTAMEWKEYDLQLEVPEDASAITYGLILAGDGKAWIDAVSVTRVPGH